MPRLGSMMRVERRKPVFKDARGVITDVLDSVPVECVTVLKTRKGAVRGNHYHKKTTQYLYVLTGRFQVFERRPGGPVERRLLRPGDILITPPWVGHAVVALAGGPRAGCAP